MLTAELYFLKAALSILMAHIFNYRKVNCLPWLIKNNIFFVPKTRDTQNRLMHLKLHFNVLIKEQNTRPHWI